MDMMMQDMNWLGIIAATIVAYVVGAVWFQPRVFGQAWMKAQPHRKAEDYKNAAAGMVVQLMVTFFAAIILSVAMGALGALWGTALLVAFYFTSSCATSIYGGHPSTWWYIVGGYEVVMVILMALVLVWSKSWGMM